MDINQNRHPNQDLKKPHTLDDVDIHCRENPDIHSFFQRVVESYEFCNAESEREQVIYVKERAEREGLKSISYQVIADFFTFPSKSTVQHHLGKVNDEAGRLGAKRLLTNDQHREIVWFVNELTSNNNPPTFEDLRDHLIRKYDLVLKLESIRHYISYSSDFKAIDGVPKNSCRVHYNQNELDNFFAELEELLSIAKIPGEFIFNIDEMGHSEYTDSHTRRVIVNSQFVGYKTDVPVRRNSKRSSMLAGVSADGSCLKPLIIVERETIERELLDSGYTPDKIIINHSKKGFITTQNFMNWSESFFIEIRKKRSLVNYDGPALLLMDGLSVHGNSEFQEMCNENNVIIKFIPAHTSDQIQVLDLGIFANQKRWMHNLNYDDEYTWQTMQVMRMFDSFRMACSPKNIIAAFRRAGMISTYNIKTRVYDVTIDRRYATEVRHWEYQKPVFKPNKNRIQLPI